MFKKIVFITITSLVVKSSLSMTVAQSFEQGNIENAERNIYKRPLFFGEVDKVHSIYDINDNPKKLDTCFILVTVP